MFRKYGILALRNTNFKFGGFAGMLKAEKRYHSIFAEKSVILFIINVLLLNYKT
jgi:hypothetical protein